MPITEPIYRLVGKRIAAAREAKRWTQLELAKNLKKQYGIKITRTSITHMEKATQRIMLHLLYPIADALDVSVSSLLPTSEEVSAAKTTIVPDMPGSEWVLKVVDDAIEKNKGKHNAD